MPTSSDVTMNDPSNDKASRRLKWFSILTSAMCLLAIVAFVGCSCFLIPQAMRFQRHAEEIPAQFSNSLETAVAQGSWVIGIACVVLAITSIIALILSIRHRIILAWSLIAVCAAVFVILAAVFQPA
ncbi:MAG: hypothetical protein P8J33_09070 [Pirellulaceae bacterium]|nr:hypothetical protein [Pirellulaceae bacterium]